MSPWLQAIRWYMSGENLKSITKPTKSLFFFFNDHHAVAIPNNVSGKILFQKKIFVALSSKQLLSSRVSFSNRI